MTKNNLLLKNTTISSEDVQSCNGLIFRGKVNAYLNHNNEYAYNERMSLLKRKSCKGCSQCGYTLESLKESISCGFLPIMPQHIEHNKLYKLEVTNISRDWETGYVDDWDYEFIEYIEEEN